MKIRRCAGYMVGRKRSKPCQYTADNTPVSLDLKNLIKFQGNISS